MKKVVIGLFLLVCSVIYADSYNILSRPTPLALSIAVNEALDAGWILVNDAHCIVVDNATIWYQTIYFEENR